MRTAASTVVTAALWSLYVGVSAAVLANVVADGSPPGLGYLFLAGAVVLTALLARVGVRLDRRRGDAARGRRQTASGVALGAGAALWPAWAFQTPFRPLCMYAYMAGESTT